MLVQNRIRPLRCIVMWNRNVLLLKFRESEVSPALSANHLIWKRKKTLGLIIAPIPKGNTSLQTSNEINASLQKLLRGNNIFTLYCTPTTKTKSKRAITWPTFCGWLQMSNLTCILHWYICLQTFNKIHVSLQKLLSGNQYQHQQKLCRKGAITEPNFCG